jgi:hypothetical protein
MACGTRPLLPDVAGSINPTASATDFEDRFVPGQTGNWLFEGDALGSTAIVNEQLVITVAEPDTIQYATLGDRAFSDFALEVDVWQRSGPVESSYGVLFRMADGGQFYRFDITGNGLFIVERHDSDGRWTRLVPDWTPTSAINQGLNVANRLKVIASGSEMAFFVNDILLIQVSDPTYASGAVALDAGSFGGGDLQVSFDNLVITRDGS